MKKIICVLVIALIPSIYTRAQSYVYDFSYEAKLYDPGNKTGSCGGVTVAAEKGKQKAEDTWSFFDPFPIEDSIPHVGVGETTVKVTVLDDSTRDIQVGIPIESIFGYKNIATDDFIAIPAVNVRLRILPTYVDENGNIQILSDQSVTIDTLQDDGSRVFNFSFDVPKGIKNGLLNIYIDDHCNFSNCNHVQTQISFGLSFIKALSFPSGCIVKKGGIMYRGRTFSQL